MVNWLKKLFPAAGKKQPEPDFSEFTELSVFACSLQGDRKSQQDYCAYATKLSPEQLRAGTLGVVCDGMGGMEGGELAGSECAVTVYKGFYQLGETDDMCAALRQLALMADRQVYDLKTADGRALNCGTTLVAAAVREDKACWVSVGDSRIYHVHNGSMTRLTRDHNLLLRLQQAVDEGKISRREAEGHPQREALISYIGKGEDLLIDTGCVAFPPASGDMLILCSDGLYKALEDSQISSLALEYACRPELLAQTLAEKALENTAIKHDNTTVLVFCYNKLPQ